MLRFLALFVAKFCSVTAMVDNLLEMFGSRDVVGFGDCYNELLRISIPRTRVNKGKRKSREFSPALLSSVLAPLLAAYSL